MIEHRVGRQRRLALFLRVAAVVTLVLALLGAALPDPARDTAGTAMVVVLVGAPAVRSAWLARRWLGKGDRRYAATAALVMAIVASGAVIASGI
jgi:hypothetical protein